jgi:hypothetical protein
MHLMDKYQDATMQLIFNKLFLFIMQMHFVQYLIFDNILYYLFILIHHSHLDLHILYRK